MLSEKEEIIQECRGNQFPLLLLDFYNSLGARNTAKVLYERRALAEDNPISYRTAQKNLCKAMQDGLTMIRQPSSCAGDSHAGVPPTKFGRIYVSRADLRVLEDLLARKCAASAADSFLFKSRHRCHTCLPRFLTGRDKATCAPLPSGILSR
ncbi:MAG: hypothetical protein JSS62_00030 [Verrucomicrobia bacterium]|nr:hypothetical protein [Verrucomicrobiota bacterium]